MKTIILLVILLSVRFTSGEINKTNNYYDSVFSEYYSGVCSLSKFDRIMSRISVIILKSAKF